MGLALLSNLAAYDFGFISVGQLEDRTANAFTTMERLERSRVTFSTGTTPSTLEPLLPRYISTVDSGNLVGHLLTLREGLLQLADQPILPPIGPAWSERHAAGLARCRADRRTGQSASNRRSASGNEAPQPLDRLEQLQQEISSTSPTLAAGSRLLARLAGHECAVITDLMAHPDDAGPLVGERFDSGKPRLGLTK